MTYEELVGAVARGWCSPENSHKQMDPDLAMAIVAEVRAALAAQPAEPVAWINRRVIYDPATDSVTGYGEPELSFERASYGYDYANAKPLVLAPPAPAAVPPGYALVPVEPTPEMVAAYLDANTKYWRLVDEQPPKVGIWRNGTPAQATEEAYRAMIAAAGDKP